MEERYIFDGERKGIIRWDSENPSNFEIDFPDEEIIKKISRYLWTEQEFNIPESDIIDDYRIDKAKPVDEDTYFNLSLCDSAMKEATGVRLMTLNEKRKLGLI